jgi:protein phosphatase
MMNSDSARLEVGALSETGYVRDENQDRMSGSQVPLGYLYIVADGMGGHRGGALAAELAVNELQRHISQAPASEPVDLVIETAFKRANEAVYQKAHSSDPATEGMGTTAVLLLVSEGLAKLAHVGDSRAYLYRGGRLSQLTRDHTVVQRMVEAGMLKPEDASNHPDASVLERAIGSAPTIEVDIHTHPLQEGDAFLLCSDGLCGYVDDGQIEAVLRNQAPAQEMAEKLVALTLARGGQDNVTVQLVKYGAPAATQAQKQTHRAASGPKPAATPRPIQAQRERPARRTLTAVIFSVTLAALFLIAYYITTLKTAELNATREMTSKLQKELATTSAALEKATARVTEAQGQLANEGRTARSTIGKLQKELQEARGAGAKAAKQAEELTKQLAAENKSAKTAAAKLQKEMQEANAAKEKALTDAKELRQKLDSKERELAHVKKQLESLTKANRASPAQQETTPTKVPSGTPPPAGAK